MLTSVVLSAYEERISKLDYWLSKTFGNAWIELKDAKGFSHLKELNKHQLTEYMLISNFIVRKFTDEGHEAARVSLSQLDPFHYETIHGFSSAKLMLDNEVLRGDLLKVQHPALPAGTVMPLQNKQATALLNELKKASLILDLVPKLKKEAETYLFAICLVNASALKENGDCISTSSKHVPGLIYTSDVPAILLAEAIIHESAHLQLYCEELREQLYLDETCSIATPLRPDLRPPAGLMHQVFVLKRLKYFYQDLLRAEFPEKSYNHRQLEKRYHAVQNEYNYGIRALDSNRSRYSPRGANIINQIMST